MLNLIKLIKNLASTKQLQMNWNNLTSIEQLSEIDEKSSSKPQIIFKHSTRCSVSSFAKKILEREYNADIEAKADVYYLDLISFRDVSGAIASRYNIVHESPQLLVINNGKCTFDTSHSSVSFEKAFS